MSNEPVTLDQFVNTIQARSDQINSSDLLAAPLVCQITGIELTGSAEQPISIYVDSHAQPWKPSKTSRRVLAACWGDTAPSEWVGRWCVLYNDEKVRFGGEQVGGIRCSHLSHITGEKKIAVTSTRGKKAVETVKPYKPQNAPEPAKELPYYPEEKFAENLQKWLDLIAAGKTSVDHLVAKIGKEYRLTTGQKSRLSTPAPEPEMEDVPPPLEDGDPFA